MIAHTLCYKKQTCRIINTCNNTTIELGWNDIEKIYRKIKAEQNKNVILRYLTEKMTHGLICEDILTAKGNFKKTFIEIFSSEYIDTINDQTVDLNDIYKNALDIFERTRSCKRHL